MNTNSTKHQQLYGFNLLFKNPGLFLLAMPISCLVTSLIAFGWLQFKTAKAESLVQHTQQVRLEARRLLTALLDAETGVRGYDISRQGDFLPSYELAIAIIPNSLEKLTHLVVENPSQTVRIKQIQVLAKTRVDLFNRNIKLINSPAQIAPKPEALLTILLEGKQAMEKTRAEIEKFIAEEERLEIQRNQQLIQQRRLTWLVLILSAGIGIGGSFIATYLWKNLDQKLDIRDRNFRESEARYRILIENFPNGAVLLFNQNLRYLLADGVGLATVGLSKEQLEGKTIHEAFSPETCNLIEPIYHQALAGTATTIEVPYADRTYKEYTLPVRNENGEVYAGIVMTQDITENKRAEEQLHQVNRALQTLSECNQALVRARDEPTLLQDICRIIIEFGGYHSAWIGFAEQDQAKMVHPVAQAGFPESYFESLQITWSNTEQGNGPVGIAIRTRSSCITQNTLTEPVYTPWRSAAVKRGYTSSITLPLLTGEQVLGALSIYAIEPNAFDSSEVRLLTELANDLAYGIAALRTQVEHQQTLSTLQETSQTLRALIQASPLAITTTGFDGRVKVWNPAAQRLFGWSEAEVVGATLPIIPDHKQQEDQKICEQVFQGQSFIGMETRRQKQDGTLIDVSLSTAPLSDANGQVNAIMAVFADITAQKQAEQEIIRLNKNLELRAVESETRYQQIVELAEEGIWVIDRDAKTIYVNQAMVRMLGYSEAQMLGRPIFDFISDVESNQECCLIAFGSHTQVERCEQKLKTSGGKELWVYMSASPVLDEQGEMLKSFILVYDISDRKQAEVRLRESSEKISLVNTELARATRLKDEFLASMSHELRTPLNAILGLSEALQEEVYGPLTVKQRRSLGTIEQSGRHLLELITDILDLSKIESGKMELQIEPIALEKLCQSSLTIVRQLAHQKNIMLNFKFAHPLGDIEVDERRIRQVLVNLLSNAVKFTPEGGEVSLEVEVDSDMAILQLSVIDTGIGIAPENIDKLFKPFMQLDSSLSRRYAGTGLGLALVRRLVELHEGSVTLESEIGKGSRFTVTLPWKEALLKQHLQQKEQVELNLSSLNRALIVEDSKTAAKQVARYLAELGASATIYPAGEGSIEVALRLVPDVIILDLLLPHLSGWEVLHQLKANQTTQDIPVLIISVVDERSRALELGASDFLIKPISRQQFQLALSKIFSDASASSTQTALVVKSENEQQSPLILLVEDNEANISTIMDFLHIQDYQVSLARNGREAVEMAKQQQPNLILMDIQMPEMDGLEATCRIQADADTATIPIIAVTALAMPGDRERCLAAGAKAYLTKPVSLKNLQNIINQYIK